MSTPSGTAHSHIGNGVAGAIAPELFKRLGCEIVPLFCDVDGNFPNHHPDPGKPENLVDLIAKVKETIEKYDHCVIGVSEGIKGKDGKFHIGLRRHGAPFGTV